MKVFFSHSKILDTLGEEGTELNHKLHLEELAKRLEAQGAKIIEITRFNVVAEIEALEHFFEYEFDVMEGFIGKVESKIKSLFNYFNHAEVCPHEGNSGS